MSDTTNPILTILKKIYSGYKVIATKINDLINGENTDGKNKKDSDTLGTDLHSNETVLVGGWRLKITDEEGKTVYNEQLIFNRPNPEDPKLCLPKTIGRYDEKYYEALGIEFDPTYDINIKGMWKGSKHVHRLHAYLLYNRETKQITIHKYPREPEVDNGMFDSNGKDVDTITIENNTKVWLGPSIILNFTNPGKIANAKPQKKVKDVDDNTYVKTSNPGRMPGRGR